MLVTVSRPFSTTVLHLGCVKQFRHFFSIPKPPHRLQQRKKELFAGTFFLAGLRHDKPPRPSNPSALMRRHTPFPSLNSLCVISASAYIRRRFSMLKNDRKIVEIFLEYFFPIIFVFDPVKCALQGRTIRSASARMQHISPPSLKQTELGKQKRDAVSLVLLYTILSQKWQNYTG